MGGGPSRSVPFMAKGLSEAGIDLTLLTRYSDDMNMRALSGTNVKLKPFKKGLFNKEVEKLIRDNSFDLVQLQSIWDWEYHKLARLCRKHNIPYLLTPRGMLEPWSLQQKKWKKKIARWLYQDKDLKKCACIYTTSELEAYHIRELGFNNPICIIPNGIELNGYPCRTDLTQVKKQVLFLSRIHPKKGIEVLIDAWKRLVPNFPDWQLLIVGNGDPGYIEELNRIVSAAELHEFIRVLPPVFGKEKQEMYSSSSLFVLPSYSENYGMVIAEALSCGVPVITTDNTPWDILNKTNTGWCIPLDLNSLTTCIKEALELSEETLFEMGQRGSKMVAELFDYKKVAVMNKRLYEWIINGGETPPFII